VGLKNQIGTGVDDIDPRAICSLPLGQIPSGELIAARVGRYGPYLQVGDTDRRANLPEEIAPDELDVPRALHLIEQADLANRPLGDDPETGKPIYVKSGRFGPYVQLGDPELTPKGNIKKGSKPKMSSLFPDMRVETLTLDQALFLLSFPKVLGQHPEHGADIVVQDGQFGPYVSMEVDGKRDTRSLENHEQLQNITFDEALALLREPKVRGRQARAAQGPLVTLNPSPVTGAPIEVRTGRFGPYVTDGEVNATIPTTRDPSTLTFDDALELIAQREERMRQQGKDPRPKKKAGAETGGAKKATAKKATAKKATAKKATAKKATAKKAAAKKATAKKAMAKKATAKKGAS
jgi:DNA topoisomerase-1